MIGVFVALDMFLFYVFWEVMLVPMYFLIGVWGGERRIYAAVKFVLYTVVGSLLMLRRDHRALPAMHGQRDRAPSRSTSPTLTAAIASGGSLIAGHDAAAGSSGLRARLRSSRCRSSRSTPGCPTRTSRRRPPGSVILAGVLLKMGTYGFMRFNLPLFPEASRALRAAASARSRSSGSSTARSWRWCSPTSRSSSPTRRSATSASCVLGIFALHRQGLQGALYQMLNHGLSTGALFLIVGMIYERRHTRLIADFGGLGDADAASSRRSS